MSIITVKDSNFFSSLVLVLPFCLLLLIDKAVFIQNMILDLCFRPVIPAPQEHKEGESQIEGVPGLWRQVLSILGNLMRPSLNIEGPYGIHNYA